MKTKSVHQNYGDCRRNNVLSFVVSVMFLFAFFSPNASVYGDCIVTKGGTIAGYESKCGCYDPCLITSTCAASGGYGTLEYRWLYSTDNCQSWQCIPSSNNAYYNPGVICVTTHYKRQARRTCCATWVACSNTICKQVGEYPSSTISADGPLTFCWGGSVELCAPACANVTYSWSNGATTQCITATCSGKYEVTVTNACGCSSTSCKWVNVNPLPSSCISGNCHFCAGGSTVLEAPAGCATYSWNTGATTRCITVTCEGNYCVTVTNHEGCSSSSSKWVSKDPIPSSCISGDKSFCKGGSTVLEAPAGCATYSWNTGATTRCITVTCAGNYCVTVTSHAGCSSSSSVYVKENPVPSCCITGNLVIGNGCTTLRAPLGCSSYSWSNGATTRCITVSCVGVYHVTVWNSYGCSSTCCVTVVHCNTPSRSSILTMDNSSETIESMVYPNPFNTNATIQFENTSATAKTVVEIFSMDGAKAAELYNGETEFGQLYKIDWDASSYPNGLYMYRITCGDQVVTGRMMHQDSK